MYVVSSVSVVDISDTLSLNAKVTNKGCFAKARTGDVAMAPPILPRVKLVIRVRMPGLASEL